MKTPPPISEIEKWLREENPLGLFNDPIFSIKDIDSKSWSGHFNYLVKIGKSKFVLRFKGPEWGEPTKGIMDEFKILKGLEKYRVAPKIYYLSKNFFGEPMLLEEYLVGKNFYGLSVDGQTSFSSKIAKYVARLNRIPLDKGIFPFRESLTNYRVHKKEWRDKLKIILNDPRIKKWGRKIEVLLPQAEKMLDSFEPRLKRVLKKSGPAFIFISSHAGHCIKTKLGPRFLNWEQVSYGDPSYTLAVFLASVSRRAYFGEVKEQMVRTYLKKNPIPEFKELVEQRLKEREVSNLLWVLWAYMERTDARPVELGTSVSERFERVNRML